MSPLINIPKTVDPRGRGYIITVKVCAGASKNTVKVDEEMVRVYVTQVPESGKANLAVIKLISKEWKVPKSSFEILTGHHSPLKTILLLT
jgi:uncharacterized protein YggU (UPF0235/DUF167 family)